MTVSATRYPLGVHHLDTMDFKEKPEVLKPPPRKESLVARDRLPVPKRRTTAQKLAPRSPLTGVVADIRRGTPPAATPGAPQVDATPRISPPLIPIGGQQVPLRRTKTDPEHATPGAPTPEKNVAQRAWRSLKGALGKGAAAKTRRPIPQAMGEGKVVKIWDQESVERWVSGMQIAARKYADPSGGERVLEELEGLLRRSTEDAVDRLREDEGGRLRSLSTFLKCAAEIDGGSAIPKGKDKELRAAAEFAREHRLLDAEGKFVRKPEVLPAHDFIALGDPSGHPDERPDDAAIEKQVESLREAVGLLRALAA